MSASFLQKSSFFIKLTHWEYWPGTIVYLPAFICWIFFSIRTRSIFFFSAVNPVIETGGLRGESKISIYRRLPKSFIPITLYVPSWWRNLPEISKRMDDLKLSYPIIVKPDIGERGIFVEKIENETALIKYLQKNTFDLVIQEYVDLPMEISILHYKNPGDVKGKITSVCVKKYLSIVGDGKSTLEELIKSYPRALLQWNMLSETYANRLAEIPKMGAKIVLSSIGNHCRGAMFLNGSEHIDETLTQFFDGLMDTLPEIHYGRYDMKCNSIEELKCGKNFKILEFNGVGSDPAHIYHPGYSYFQAAKDLCHHWQILFQLYQIQKAKGWRGMTIKEASFHLRSYSAYIKALEKASLL